ncbi:MAG: cyclic nucleotide-binding domain-containing protein [Proteobacteria bacterium]|nr:cyclic nucleotide-binding domain-containing protein [Pseudomonadota bacterium]
MTVTEFLKTSVPFLAGLTEEQAHALAESAEQIVFNKLQTILMQGETVDHVHVVATGKVQVVRKERGKDAVVLAELGPGDVFGEVSIVEPGVAGASIRAVDETLVFLISQAPFLQVLEGNPAVKERIMAEIA